MSEPFTSMHTCTHSTFACVNMQSKKVLYSIYYVFLLFPFSVLWEVYKEPQTCNFWDCEHAALSHPRIVLCIGVLGITREVGIEKGFIFLLPMSSNSLFYNISSDTCISQTSCVKLFKATKHRQFLYIRCCFTLCFSPSRASLIFLLFHGEENQKIWVQHCVLYNWKHANRSWKRAY